MQISTVYEGEKERKNKGPSCLHLHTPPSPLSGRNGIRIGKHVELLYSSGPSISSRKFSPGCYLID